MSAPVVHINLLQHGAPARTVARALAAALALSLAGMAGYAHWLQRDLGQARQQAHAAAQRLQQARTRIAALPGASAAAIADGAAPAPRGELDALRAQVQAAQALAQALQASAARGDELLRALGALAALREPDLWLTGVSFNAEGPRLEVQGAARDGAAVLRFARRANELLRPLALRLDGLELQPQGAATAQVAGATGAAGADAAPLAFRLY